MVALLTALGFKHALDESEFDKITKGLFEGLPNPREAYIRDGSCELMLERRRNMGPFSLVLRLPHMGGDPMDSLLPMVRETAGRRLTRVRMTEPRQGVFLMTAADTKTKEQITFYPTAVQPIFQQNPAAPEGPLLLDGTYAVYALSADAEVILGNETNTQKMADQWQNAASPAERDGLLKERLLKEDALSVVDAYFVEQAEPATYQLMGVIAHVDKLLNPVTEEWVYRLFVRINSEGYGVYIHPEMLVGEPRVGRRFKGKVTFFGMMNPKELSADRDNGFY